MSSPEVSLLQPGLFAHVVGDCRQWETLALSRQWWESPAAVTALLFSKEEVDLVELATRPKSAQSWCQEHASPRLLSVFKSTVVMFSWKWTIVLILWPWRCWMGIYPRISMYQHPQGWCQSVSGSEAISGWDGSVGAALSGDAFSSQSPPLPGDQFSEHWSFLPSVGTPRCHWSHLDIFNVESLISI